MNRNLNQHLSLTYSMNLSQHLNLTYSLYLSGENA
jgi:hypothetical protein